MLTANTDASKPLSTEDEIAEWKAAYIDSKRATSTVPLIGYNLELALNDEPIGWMFQAMTERRAQMMEETGYYPLLGTLYTVLNWERVE